MSTTLTPRNSVPIINSDPNIDKPYQYWITGNILLPDNTGTNAGVVPFQSPVALDEPITCSHILNFIEHIKVDNAKKGMLNAIPLVMNVIKLH